jgi:hypothetical protein
MMAMIVTETLTSVIESARRCLASDYRYISRWELPGRSRHPVEGSARENNEQEVQCQNDLAHYRHMQRGQDE